MLTTLEVVNLLSFTRTKIHLTGITVLTGDNFQERHDLLDLIAMLNTIPSNLSEFISDHGGIYHWMKPSQDKPGQHSITINFSSDPLGTAAAYSLNFEEESAHLTIAAECLSEPATEPANSQHFMQRTRNTVKLFNYRNPNRPTETVAENLTRHQTVINQIRNPESYPQLNALTSRLSNIRAYRNWNVGRANPARSWQPTNQESDYPNESFDNLATVVEKLLQTPQMTTIQSFINEAMPNFKELNVSLIPDNAQISVLYTDQDQTFTAQRLSDNILHLIALATLLCHPRPPALLCIDQPEISSNPQILDVIAAMIGHAAAKTQVVISTNSNELIDRLNDLDQAQPETLLSVVQPHF